MFKGITLSVLASVCFGLMYYYTQFLTAFDSEEIFGWRIITTLPLLTLFMYAVGELKLVADIVYRVKKQPRLIAVILFTASMCGIQLWLFLWAPINGRGLQVSLGYFLLPLVLVLSGCVFYREKMTKFQVIAVACAAVGVGHEIWRQGSMSWETWLVAGGYSLYFIVRRRFKTDHLGGFWWDMLICLPIACYLVIRSGETLSLLTMQPMLVLVLFGLGLLSTVGLGSYILASRALPLVLFGLLSYLEPVLLVLASLVIGERIAADEWWTYIPIWIAVMILTIEGVFYIMKQRYKKLKLTRDMQALEHIKSKVKHSDG